MEDVCEEAAELVEALDVGEKELVACVRVPHEGKPGRRRQEVRERRASLAHATAPGS